MILSDKEIRLDIYVNSPVMLRHTMVNIVVTGDTIISGSPVLPCLQVNGWCEALITWETIFLVVFVMSTRHPSHTL